MHKCHRCRCWRDSKPWDTSFPRSYSTVHGMIPYWIPTMFILNHYFILKIVKFDCLNHVESICGRKVCEGLLRVRNTWGKLIRIEFLLEVWVGSLFIETLLRLYLREAFYRDLVLIHHQVVLPFFWHYDFFTCFFLVLRLQVLYRFLLLCQLLLQHIFIGSFIKRLLFDLYY